MATAKITKEGRRISPHRPGDRHKNRKGKHGLIVFFTDDELAAITVRAQKDGITKQEAGHTLLLNYAKRGLTPT
jgi:hypothetical protein